MQTRGGGIKIGLLQPRQPLFVGSIVRESLNQRLPIRCHTVTGQKQEGDAGKTKDHSHGTAVRRAAAIQVHSGEQHDAGDDEGDERPNGDDHQVLHHAEADVRPGRVQTEGEYATPRTT